MSKRTRSFEENKRKEYSRKKLNRVLVPAIAIAGLGCIFYMVKPSIERMFEVPITVSELVTNTPYKSRKTEVSFEEANENPSLRRRYLER